MKPIYIKMSAFGSYAGEETVEFTDINNGIFLITGDTGAGKTTIFDAITYALYDETSGGKRNGEMMRSQYAGDDISTYVEYRFTYHGEAYTIIRSPRQKRLSKRRNKDGDYAITIEQPMVTLILPDGQQFMGKIKETNQKIIDIIGLEVNQFTQIAMIAQGDFLKLLHASSKERKEIFTKIFSTKIYWQIEEELKRRKNAIDGQLEDNKKDIIREIEDVKSIKGSELEAGWETMAVFTETESDKLLEFINLIIDEAKLKEEEIKKALAINTQNLDEINTKIQQAEDINKLFTSLDEALLKKEQLDQRKDEMAAVRKRIEKGKKAKAVEPKETAFLNKQKELSECKHRIMDITVWLENNLDKLKGIQKAKEQKEEEYRKNSPGLISKISSIDKLLPQYGELDTYNKELSILEEKKTKAKIEYDELIKTIAEVKGSKEEVSEQQNHLKIIADQYNQLTHSVERLTEKHDALVNLLGSYKSMKSLCISYENKVGVHKKANEYYELKKKNYDELYHSFIEGQASILAASLEAGCPCPVCGSTSHPQKASHTDVYIDESQLRTAKKEMDEGLVAMQEKYDLLQKAKQSYENKLELVMHEGKRIVDTSFNPEVISDTNIESMLEECDNQLKTEAERRNQAKEASEKYSSNQDRLQSLEEALESYDKGKEEAQKRLQDIENKSIETNTIIIRLKKDLIYESRLIAQEELSVTNDMLQGLEKDKAKAAEEYQFVIDSTNRKQGNLKSEEESFRRLSEDTQRAEKELNNEIIKQGFFKVEEYRKAILSSQKIDELSVLDQEYRDEIIKNDTSIENYKEQTEGKTRIQTSALEEKRTELNNIKVQLDEESKAVYGIRARDEEIYKKATRLISEREKVKKTHGDIKRLADTANGKLSGRHLNFQTYIQRRYFNMILHEANKRLYTMSNNQFILKCRDMEDLTGQGEVGLELDVYSMVNDQVRDVKTLSGGESFMAALAMALGMSDIIQNTAGRIHIDTMFIDEGFGSLSEDTRRQAIKILNDLSGGKRLVGIISHVTELKAQIGTKLVITKGEKGSRAKWEIS